jgi:hypothetical protein
MMELVFSAAKNFDFLATEAPLVTALMMVRTVPSRMPGRPVATPPTLRLARDPGALPGWVILGEVPGREVVFGAMGTFWTPEPGALRTSEVLTDRVTPSSSSVDLFWLPLGAGDGSRLVRWGGLAFEAIVAGVQHRQRRDLSGLARSFAPVSLRGAPMERRSHPGRGPDRRTS